MRERERQQSWRRTRRELHKTLSRDGRKWIKEVWGAAAGIAGRFDRLSPLTTVLGNRLVESYATRERLEGEDLERALRVAVVTGYACRMVVVDPTGQPSLRPSAFNLGAKATAEALASDDAGVNKLLDPVRTIATERFDSVMALPPEIWSAYVATATQKLQRQFTGKILRQAQLAGARSRADREDAPVRLRAVLSGRGDRCRTAGARARRLACRQQLREVDCGRHRLVAGVVRVQVVAAVVGGVEHRRGRRDRRPRWRSRSRRRTRRWCGSSC